MFYYFYFYQKIFQEKKALLKKKRNLFGQTLAFLPPRKTLRTLNIMFIFFSSLNILNRKFG